MTKRDESKAKTRELTVATARKLFNRDGYEATTIRGIAAEMRMSTGAVFANFAGKAQLFEAVYGVSPLDPVEALKLDPRVPMAEAA